VQESDREVLRRVCKYPLTSTPNVGMVDNERRENKGIHKPYLYFCGCFVSVSSFFVYFHVHVGNAGK